MNPLNKPNTDDVRIREIKELVPPSHVFREFPVLLRFSRPWFFLPNNVPRLTL